MSEFVVEDDRGIRWEPVRRQMMIGRGWDNDLRLRSGFASRRHAWVWRRGNHVVIEDLGSLHGTFVNGQLLRTPCLLHHNDVVAIGDARLTYIQQREPYTERGAIPPGEKLWHDPERTPPLGVQHLMVSQAYCSQCGAANHPASRLCVRCGRPLGAASGADVEGRGAQQQARHVQHMTPDEPVVVQPFPQTAGSSGGRSLTEKGIWALAIIMAILTVILLMILGVLLVFALG
jgi:hypothetical protein